jgi:hypothetical protein
MVKVKLTSPIGQVISKQVVLDVKMRLMTIYCYDCFQDMASWVAPTGDKGKEREKMYWLEPLDMPKLRILSWIRNGCSK